jgi:hypothetical protein
MKCSKDAGGNVTLALTGSSSEAGSVIDGSLVATANTPVDLGDVGPDTGFEQFDNVNDDFEAPSGAQGILEGAAGINSLGSDCWSNWTGIS